MWAAFKESQMRRAIMAAVVVGAWVGLADAASAATISGGATPVGPPPSAVAQPLVVSAAADESNHIEVVGAPGGFIVRETGTTPLTDTAASCNPTGTPREYLCGLTVPGYAAVTPIIVVNLGDEADTFRGSAQPLPIVVSGGDGNDTLASGAGLQNSLDGGNGTDTVDYSTEHPAAVTVTLDNVANDGGANDGGSENALNMERIVGGAGDDSLTGSSGENRLDGGPGNDVLDSLDGPDVLVGGGGNDQLTGGSGVDTYQGGDGDDVVTAFDGLTEDVDCGAGSDDATVDIPDRLVGCETVRRVGENLDVDGDGALPPEDCDNNDARIKPGATDVPRNGIDEDCSGSDAKRRTVASTITYLWAFNDVFAQARKFTVKKVPARGVVRVKCKSPKGRKGACPFKAKRRETVGGARKMRFLSAFKKRKLPVGTVIEARITRKDWVGKVIRFKVRSGKVPRLTTRCLPPGKKKPRKC